MPMYEFICGECETDFEKLVASAGAVASVECPSCGSKKVHKKLSVFAKAGATSPTSYSSGYSGGGHCCGGSCSCH
ncbi:MAG: zinc ribbon domain-containing protein [Candidatus Tectomicrobia bacterium]|nr:zinc ribbon domain-containing protein [Candidatus Tectomicrobia bacterium]MBI2178347.1 zinc ribbon domain-containing protein [Candidatus Tectomicrobia bacterium]MBI3025922.1 zinc ribbon domain-containing protein [Candidatus Tectomicrobia bacterium]